MKWVFLLAIGWAAAVCGFAAGEPRLPEWGKDELKALQSAGWLPGADLLTGDPLPDDPSPLVVEPLELEPPLAEEIAGDGMEFTPVAEEFLADYFAARPGTFLVDPQKCLSPKDHAGRLEFLNYHAEDSSVDLYVYVVGGDQEIPSEVRKEELIERFFSEGRPSAVVFYYYGAPQRATLSLSPQLAERISASEQHRALESSVMQAMEKSQAADQFEKFLVQMSIRIYWLEQSIAEREQASEAALDPVIFRAAKDGVKADRLQVIRELAAPYLEPVAWGGGGLAVLLVLVQWMRMRSRYDFPEFEVEPRLGGDHAAGVGAVISFSSASLPPASQRDQVPDYLRRA
jgi:hypothetical protein